MRALSIRRALVAPSCSSLRRQTLCCAAAASDESPHPKKWKTRHSSTPATPDDAATAASKLVKEKVWEKQVNPKKTLFPWRHETEPLERLLDTSIQGGVLGPHMGGAPFWIKHLFTQAAAVHLNVPWYKVMTTSTWSQELADASGFAFSQAVAGVLSNTYKVPFQECMSEDGAVEFATVTKVKDDDDEEDKTDDDPNEEGESTDTEESVTPELEYMMEEKLRKLYQASHEFGKDQMRIQLETQPIHCELVSLLFIPYLTRQAVHDAPSLRHSFRNMFRAVQKKSMDEQGNGAGVVALAQEAFRVFQDFVNSRAQLNREDNSVSMESTVIAQVLIECDEVFSVTDVATGMLVQGHGEKQRVYHLVRLEVVVKEQIPLGGGKPVFHVQSWQIVDWDDLEGGNIWYI